MKVWEVWMNGWRDPQQFIGDVVPKLLNVVYADDYDGACEIVAHAYNSKRSDTAYHMVRRPDKYYPRMSTWVIWGIQVHCSIVKDQERHKRLIAMLGDSGDENTAVEWPRGEVEE